MWHMLMLTELLLPANEKGESGAIVMAVLGKDNPCFFN